MDFQWSAVVDALPALFRGAQLTVFITVAGLVGGVIIGTVAGLMRAYGNTIVNGIAYFYIELIRGTPIVVQVMFIYFALPTLADIRIDPLSAAIIAITVNAGAYIAEIVRGAFISVDTGQMEAGRSLGMSHHITMLKVIWPQAFKRMIPPLGNQFIISIKDTSLLSVILVPELLFQGRVIASNHYNAVEIYTTVAVFYLAITLSLSAVLRVTEKRLEIRS